MDWVNNLFLALLLTDITGTIFYMVELLLRRKTKLDAGFQRFLTMTSLCAYLVPLVYFVLYIGRWLSAEGAEERINLFYNTPLTRALNAVCGYIWIGLFLILLLYRMARLIRWKWICRGNIPAEDEMVFRVLQDVCAELGIREQISVCMNDSVNMPCITYDHGYTVVMPLWQYTEEDVRVIFYHELCHFRNGDLLFKTIGSVVTLLHVFNPVAHFLFKQMKVDCEKYCDRVACKKGEDIFTDSGYFQVILNLSSEGGKWDRYQLFMLANGKSDCERRVEYMLEYQKHGGLKRNTAVILAVCFILGSSTTSLAAGSGVLALYDEVAERSSMRQAYAEDVTDGAAENEIMCRVSDDLTVVEADYTAPAMENDVTDHTVPAMAADAADNMEAAADNSDEAIVEILSKKYDVDPEDVIMMEDDGIEPLSPFYTTIWKIPAGKIYVSTGFPQKAGDWLSLMVVGSPTDIEYEMGFKDPDDIMWYVLGSDTTSQKFTLTMDGRHYVYVMNTDEERELRAEVTLVRHSAEEEEETE